MAETLITSDGAIPQWTDEEFATIVNAYIDSKVNRMAWNTDETPTDYTKFLIRLAEFMVYSQAKFPGAIILRTAMHNQYCARLVVSLIAVAFSLGMIAMADGWFRHENDQFVKYPYTTLN